MSWSEVENTDQITLRNFSAGVWPGYPQSRIPGSLDGSQPIGFRTATNWVFVNDRLEKMFGYANTNTAALNAGHVIDSLFYSPAFDQLLGTAGDKIYRNIGNAVPTDITGAVVTSGAIFDWANWQFGSTEYAIAVNGSDPPFKVPSAGNATVLAGTPLGLVGSTIESFQNSLWIAENNTVYFSALGDPQTWSANDNYVFSDDIIKIKAFGSMLVVFMPNKIGVLYGTNNRQLTKVDSFVSGVGCSARKSVAAAKIKEQDVLIFANLSGVWAFNGTSSVFKFSSPLNYCFVPGRNDTNFSIYSSLISLSSGAYAPQYNWYILQVPTVEGQVSGLTYPDCVLIFDLKNTISDFSGSFVCPSWIVTNTRGFDSISVIPLDISGADPRIYVGGDDGFVKLYDPDLATREETNNSPINISAQAFMKVFDLGAEVQFQEVNIETADFSDSSTTISVGLSMNRETDLTFPAGNTSFVIDDARVFFWQNVDVGNYGRWLQIYLEDPITSSKLSSIEGIGLVYTQFGADPNVSNTANN